MSDRTVNRKNKHKLARFRPFLDMSVLRPRLMDSDMGGVGCCVNAFLVLNDSCTVQLRLFRMNEYLNRVCVFFFKYLITWICYWYMYVDYDLVLLVVLRSGSIGVSRMCSSYISYYVFFFGGVLLFLFGGFCAKALS